MENKWGLDLNRIDMIRKTIPSQIAKEIVSVQPMEEAGKAYLELYELLKANPDKALSIKPYLEK